MRKSEYKQNYKFLDSAVLNNATFQDYLERMTKICLSMFEWVNLPSSMNSRWLERTLFYKGQAALLKDKTFGFINTECADGGYVNIYGLPTRLNCYSFEYQSMRKLYTGINPLLSEKQKDIQEYNECILVLNNYERIPTYSTIELFAYRLYEAEATAFVNIKAQKTPVLIRVNEKQRLLMENLYNQYNGNAPFIFGDKEQFNDDLLSVLKTDAPFIADKIMEYKKEIWNEFLTFIGVNNIQTEKKERLITDEASQNNELINLNLQSFLAPRLEACKQFNEKYGFTGTDKEISVRVRSDLQNVIKEALSSSRELKQDLEDVEEIENIKEGEEDGKI